MPLTTLLGTAQLAMQDALAGHLDLSNGMPRTPNFIVVSLRRDSLLQQYKGPLTQERERFRRDLEDGARAFLSSHGWRIGGTGSLVINVVLRAISSDCNVQARTVEWLYQLKVTDDNGSRDLPVRQAHAIVGRAHESHPRGFIPIHDSARVISREHLALTYSDLHLTLRLLGKNPTTLNGDTLGDAEMEVRQGDVIKCGKHEIVVGEMR
jgi:hypothetical protein